MQAFTAVEFETSFPSEQHVAKLSDRNGLWTFRLLATNPAAESLRDRTHSSAIIQLFIFNAVTLQV
jgi:hypothetical protein